MLDIKTEQDQHLYSVTVFEIVTLAQECYRGDHFCALTVHVENGNLYFQPCEYKALKDSDIPRWVKYLSMPDEQPCILEHFLQSVRKKFPGVPFNFIRVDATINWQYVYVTTDL